MRRASEKRNDAEDHFEKYLVFYRQIFEGVEIVRVIHSARDIEAIFEEEHTP